MKKLAVLALLLAAACASTDAPETLPPPAPLPDPRVGELQTQLTELLDRIDVLNHRIEQLEEGAVPAPAVERAQTPTPPPAPARTERPAQQEAAARPRVASPQQPALVAARLAEDYRQGIILFGGGRHADARSTFQQVFDADPSGDLADNALFWIGETYFAARDYTNAVRFYTRVVNEYADQNKAPDALFKTALVQERTGDLALARRTLQQVIERFPYSSMAASAKAELQRIRY